MGLNGRRYRLVDEKKKMSDVDEVIDTTSRIGVKCLNLSHRHLTILPEKLSQLQTIRILLLNNNKLILPPSEVVRLHNLRELSLAWNQLTILPSGLQRLTHLVSMDLSHNKLGCLPAEIGTLVRLRELWLVATELMSLPDEIGKLSELRILAIQHNAIGTLPSGMAGMQSLQWFSLASNKLCTLPQTVGQIHSVTYLDISDNRLREFPDAVLGIRSLNTLVVRNCGIELMPHSDRLLVLTKLYKLDMRGNPLKQTADGWEASNIQLLVDCTDEDEKLKRKLKRSSTFTVQNHDRKAAVDAINS